MDRFSQPVPTAAFGCVLQAVISQQPPLGPTPLLTFVTALPPGATPGLSSQLCEGRSGSHFSSTIFPPVLCERSPSPAQAGLPRPPGAWWARGPRLCVLVAKFAAQLPRHAYYESRY